MKNILFFMTSMLFVNIAFSQTRISQLLTESRTNPIGLDITQPRFNWQLENDKRGTVQTAYEIHVWTKDKTIVWNSGRVNSDSSVFVAYKGPELKSNTRYFWAVKVWVNDDDVAVQSKTAYFHTGFLRQSDWNARWICAGFREDTINRPSPYFRKTFKAKKQVKSAMAFITAHGMYEAYLNGRRVGDAYYTPGWTNYHKRLQYQVYDVTNLIKTNNSIAVVLASGWYRGNLGWGKKINHYGKEVALLLQLDIAYSDGTHERIVSDGSWKSSTGAIVYSEIYHGEKTDLQRDKAGWKEPFYDDSKWDGVIIRDFGYSNLVATYSEAVKEQEVFKPVKIITTPKGEKVIDFGQNLTGWVRMKVKGRAGDTIRIFHAEALDKAGNLYTRNLRAARAEDIYILKNNKEVSVHPHFTWHGFRYAKVENYPGPLAAGNFEAVALYSDMESTGSFVTSDSMINQLQRNIKWAQQGNFLDIPTDCNQRNERLGWTGDIQVFAPTALFNMRAHNFLVKWLNDVKASQSPSGEIPSYIPDLGSGLNKAGWADACTIVPWALYLAYGDKKILADQYGTMKAYVESVGSVTHDNLWDKAGTWGDWLAYQPEAGQPKLPKTNKYIIAQSYYANSVRILANSAGILGHKADAHKYSVLLKEVKNAFHRSLMNDSGDLISQSQADYVIALNFGMIPDSLAQKAAAKLAGLVRYYGHLTTGFLATALLNPMLTKYGYNDLAFSLLERKQYPSWLYMLTKGATTFWERWNGIMPDGSFQTVKPQSNSLNHYAHASIGHWLYTDVAGIKTYEDDKSVGYRHSRIEPHPGGSLKFAKASLKTYYGILSSGWTVEGDKLVLEVRIPVNTQADIVLDGNLSDIKEGDTPVKSAKGIGVKSEGASQTVLTVGSGTYKFTVNRHLPEDKRLTFTDKRTAGFK